MLCPNCGAPAGDSELFCGECGTRLRVEPPLPPGLQPLAPPKPQSGLGTGAKVALVAVLAVLLMVGLALVGSVLGCGGCCLYFAQDAPLDLALDYPRTVRVGQEFALQITCRNTADGITPLRHIGLDDNLLEGLTVVRSEPPYQRQDHLPTGITTYWYYLDLPPGDSASITLYLRADRAGDFQGDLTAFSDPGSRTAPISLTIIP